MTTKADPEWQDPRTYLIKIGSAMERARENAINHNEGRAIYELADGIDMIAVLLALQMGYTMDTEGNPLPKD